MINGNFIAGLVSNLGSQTIHGVNPATQEVLPGNFNIATENEIESAVSEAYKAWSIFKFSSGSVKADFLRSIAINIELLGDELVKRAVAESGLPEGRIIGERGRTCNQLRLFADLVEEGSWVRAIIDTALPHRKPLPRADIRKMYQSIGPVAIFGASNFPLAFSTAGGDTASAFAAGCPVIVKGHPSHPGTHNLVAQAISQAVKDCGLPAGVFSAVTGGIPVGAALVKHPKIKAVGFTGSFSGGKALMKASFEREEPIPVYAEMGSVNPIFILKDQLEGDLEKLADKIANAVNLGAGQFCTNPGIIVLPPHENVDNFTDALQIAFENLISFTMLNEGIHKSYSSQKENAVTEKNVGVLYAINEDGKWSAKPTLAITKASEFVKNNRLHYEIFGPFSMLVTCESKEEMLEVANSLEGQLTCTVMGSNENIVEQFSLVHTLHEKAGRLIFNDVPTGVEVGYAMHHGGPYPAASSSMYTSVGTDAILRFVRPVCFQNAPQPILPDALKDENPLDIWRIVDGQMSKTVL